MPQGVYDRKPPEIPKYIREHAADDLTIRQVRDMLQRDLGYDLTYEYVKGWYRREKLPHKMGWCPNKLLTEEQSEYMIGIIPGRSSAEIAEMMNEKYGLSLAGHQIRSWKKNHQTPSGYDTRFRPGRRPFTKGKRWEDYLSPESQAASLRTAFKRGNVPANHKQVGAITERDGYLWIKLTDGSGVKNWTMYHRWLWEQENGPIPEGYKLFFLDGNRLNCSLENLQLVDAGTLVVANQKYGTSTDPELNQVILKAAELRRAVSKAEKKKRKNKK